MDSDFMSRPFYANGEIKSTLFRSPAHTGIRWLNFSCDEPSPVRRTSAQVAIYADKGRDRQAARQQQGRNAQNAGGTALGLR
jgi:hypothetical protein